MEASALAKRLPWVATGQSQRERAAFFVDGSWGRSARRTVVPTGTSMYTYQLVDDGINVFRDSMSAANVVYVAATGPFEEPNISIKGLGGGQEQLARQRQWTFCSTRRIPAATTIRFAGFTSTPVDGRCVLDRCVLLRYFGTCNTPHTPPYRLHHWHQQGLADHLRPSDRRTTSGTDLCHP